MRQKLLLKLGGAGFDGLEPGLDDQGQGPRVLPGSIGLVPYGNRSEERSRRRAANAGKLAGVIVEVVQQHLLYEDFGGLGSAGPELPEEPFRERGFAVGKSAVPRL